MSKYIGAEAPYGIFERQELSALANGTTREFPLIYKATDANSLLVVEMGFVKQPGTDYSLTAGGTRIVFDEAPSAGTSLYLIYLGKQLSVPAAIGNKPLWYKFTANGAQDEFQLVNPYTGDNELPLTEHGLIIFKNGVQQKFQKVTFSSSGDVTVVESGDFYITLDNKIKFVTTPLLDERIDIHIIGTQRSDLVTVDDGAITAQKIANQTITAEKLNLLFRPYTPTVSTFNGMSASAIIKEAEYQELFPLVKARVKFDVTLSGTQDNKVRFTLPKNNNGSTIISATAVIRTASTIESGIVQWGSLGAFDVYRPSGVNFSLTQHTIELAFEYRSA